MKMSKKTSSAVMLPEYKNSLFCEDFDLWCFAPINDDA